MSNNYSSGSPGASDSNMPTAVHGLMPRRSSYASVVSGTASATSQIYQQPARSGAFAHLMNQNADYNYEQTYLISGAQARYDPQALYEMDFGRNGGVNGRLGLWGRIGNLSDYSRAFLPMMNDRDKYGGSSGATIIDNFFVPSYLKGSRYVQKLEEINRAKVLAHRDGPSAQSSQPGSLSTSAGSINLHAKVGATHRGLAFDIIEKAPPAEVEILAPLPSKWSNQDKHGGLEVMSDGQEVKFTGPKGDREHEACAIRADAPMPPQCGIYYFEVTIISRKREESSIGIGFSSKNVPLSRLPGWEPESWAYHGDDGHSFGCQSTGKHYGPPFTTGDIVGCGVNFRSGTAFFTKNGDHLGIAFHEIKGRLFPSVGMKKSGEHVRVNFGQSPFVFDIDGMMSVSRLSNPVSDRLSSPSIESEPGAIPELLFSAGFPEVSPAMAIWMMTKITEESPKLKRFLNTFSAVPGGGAQIDLREMAEKKRIELEIEGTSTSNLAPPLNETELIQSLVLQFLTHDGYIETARAFADEVHSEKKALTIDPAAIVPTFTVKEDEDAGHRQRIRTAVLEGDVEKALKYTNAFYPQVLKDNEHVYFRLRCRRFIEMIRQGAEMQLSSIPTIKKSNGHNGDWYDDIINHDMDLDEQQSQNNQWDQMDTEELSEIQVEYHKLLQDTLAYGKVLQAEFKDDPRREVSKALEDAFSLIAYQDPLNAKDVSHFLDPEGRVAVAEELNSAILLSLGKSSSAALETLYQQTSVLLEDLQESGGSACVVNIDDYAKPKGVS